MNVTLIVLCVCGFLLHFLSRYGEFARGVERISPLEYILKDWPAWVAAVVSTIVCMILLQDLVAFTAGIDVPLSVETVLRLLALTAGYSGSSIAAKIPTWITGVWRLR